MSNSFRSLGDRVSAQLSSAERNYTNPGDLKKSVDQIRNVWDSAEIKYGTPDLHPNRNGDT